MKSLVVPGDVSCDERAPHIPVQKAGFPRHGNKACALQKLGWQTARAVVRMPKPRKGGDLRAAFPGARLLSLSLGAFRAARALVGVGCRFAPAAGAGVGTLCAFFAHCALFCPFWGALCAFLGAARPRAARRCFGAGGGAWLFERRGAWLCEPIGSCRAVRLPAADLVQHQRAALSAWSRHVKFSLALNFTSGVHRRRAVGKHGDTPSGVATDSGYIRFG